MKKKKKKVKKKRNVQKNQKDLQKYIRDINVDFLVSHGFKKDKVIQKYDHYSSNINDVIKSLVNKKIYLQPPRLVGRREYVFVDDCPFRIQAKLDTGAFSCSISALNIKTEEIDGKKFVEFDIVHKTVSESYDPSKGLKLKRGKKVEEDEDLEEERREEEEEGKENEDDSSDEQEEKTQLDNEKDGEGDNPSNEGNEWKFPNTLHFRKVVIRMAKVKDKKVRPVVKFKLRFHLRVNEVEVNLIDRTNYINCMLIGYKTLNLFNLAVCTRRNMEYSLSKLAGYAVNLSPVSVAAPKKTKQPIVEIMFKEGARERMLQKSKDAKNRTKENKEIEEPRPSPFEKPKTNEQ